MNMSKLLAIVIAALMLTGCVGFIVPIPQKSSGGGAPTTDQQEKR